MAEKDKKEIAEEAYRLAEDYERRCTGCAQSVVAGMLDALGMEDEGVFKAASGKIWDLQPNGLFRQSLV